MTRSHGAMILARYSTDNQNPDSIEVQVEKCTSWCQEHGLPILGVYADMAVSGMKDSRPQYDLMIQQLNLGIGDTVVIYDQSRMFRKMTAWFAFRDEISRLGVSVVSVTQPMIGKDLRDPTNFLAEGSMALFNQIWALQTRQKVIEKMRFMANHGQHTGGTPPLGYCIVDGRLDIDPKEAAIVRRIFEEYAAGKSYRSIIAGLNADGLTTKRGKPFGSNSLHDLLRNEKYIGTLVYGRAPHREDGTRNSHGQAPENLIRIEDAIPAIVDRSVFDAVQRRLDINKKQHSGRPPELREYPLRGKVFCGDCKSAMYIRSIKKPNRTYFYYNCCAQNRLHKCDALSIRADYLEDRVAAALRATLGSPTQSQHLIQILRDQAAQLQSGAVTKLQSLIDHQRSIQVQLDNATQAILDGLNSPALTAKIRALESDKARIDRDLAELRHTVDASSLPESQLQAILDQCIQGCSTDNAVLLSIVSRVEVARDTITIWTILDTDHDGRINYDAPGISADYLSAPSGSVDASSPEVMQTVGVAPPAPCRSMRFRLLRHFSYLPIDGHGILPRPAEHIEKDTADPGLCPFCLFQLPVLHPQAHIGGLGNGGVVGDDDDAPILLMGKAAEDVHDIAAVFAVQISGGLIPQHDLRTRRQRSCNGHTLLLTAGEHIGQPLELILLKPHLKQLLPGDTLGFLPGHLPHIQGVCGIFQHGQVVKQVVVLVDHRHMVQPVGIPVHAGGGFAVQLCASGGGDIQSRQQRKQGGLAAAGSTHDGVHQPLLECAANSIDRLHGLNRGSIFIPNILGN